MNWLEGVGDQQVFRTDSQLCQHLRVNGRGAGGNHRVGSGILLYVPVDRLLGSGVLGHSLKNKGAFGKMRGVIGDAQQAQGDSEQTFTGGVLRITPERVQLVFDDKPAAEIRDIVKQWGFRWAPSQGAWQRQNTANGRYAAKQAIKAIEEAAQ